MSSPETTSRMRCIVSVLFSEPKIPQFAVRAVVTATRQVSVLFSEPKIPQCAPFAPDALFVSGFSALQRAENSSIAFPKRRTRVSASPFQCSSASRKFLNVTNSKASHFSTSCFSALQRAENSSILEEYRSRGRHTSFSALQRAENSSIPTLAPASIHISDRDDHASSFLSLPGASP